MAGITSTLTSVTTALFGADGAIPTFFSWLTSADVLPYFAIGIAISILLLGVKVVKSVFWGA